MFSWLKAFLTTDSLSPHGICLTWRPELIWTHVASDAIIGIAYFSIPVVLAGFVSKRRDVAFGWVFWFFAAFILACGTTHFMSIWTLWVPDYGLEALIKAFTAVVSIGTAIALWPLLPKALALPSPAQLRAMNEALTERIAERDTALASLAHANVEREKAESMLRQAQKMEAIGKFTGSVAHDFNNLLGVVMANIDYIDRKASLTDRQGQALRDALDASSRGAALIHKLLAFSRKQPLLPVRVDVNALIEDMIPLLHGALGTCYLKTDLAAKGFVLVDPNQLESALLNLAVNARDAMPSGGALVIRTRNDVGRDGARIGAMTNEVVVIDVEDTGLGMPKAVLERAFEPFFTTKPEGQGTGLGLSQVFGFVAQSGGAAHLHSEPGAGTCVTLCLPKDDLDIERSSPSSSESPATSRPLPTSAA